MKRWGGVSEIAVRTETFRGDVDAVREAEAERLWRALAERDRVVVLDERGDDLDTGALTKMIQHGRETGVSRMVFAIGGAYGHAAVSRERAHRVIRLSSMVLNHEVARVVLYEQLYRAMAAIHGTPYAH